MIVTHCVLKGGLGAGSGNRAWAKRSAARPINLSGCPWRPLAACRQQKKKGSYCREEEEEEKKEEGVACQLVGIEKD